MQKTLFNLILFFIILILFYFALVIIDVILPRYPKFFSEKYKISSNILKEREKKDQNVLNSEEFKNYKKMIYPFDYNYFPLSEIVRKNKFMKVSSISNYQAILCNEGYGHKIINTDRFGFRNPDYLWDQNINTVIIGDSLVEGQCVNYNQTISGIFNKNKIKTLTLASGGNSSIYYASLAKIYLEEIQPKNIILLFHENDHSLVDSTELISDYYTLLNKKDFITRKEGMLIEADKAKQFNNDILNYLNDRELKTNFIFKIKFNFNKLKKYLMLTHLKEYYFFYFKRDKLFNTTELAINELINFCELNNCNVYFGLARSSSFWDPRLFYENFKFSLSKYLEKHDLELIDFDQEIDHEKREYYAPKGPHHSIKGLEIISNKLISIISNANK